MSQTKPIEHKESDVTGRDRMVVNTLVSWASELFIMIIGFVVPRLMDETLGQEMLGIWDFAWTFINFLRLASLGISSSVNRFVSKYRTEKQFDQLNVFVSTVVSIQTVIALLVALSLIPICYFVEKFYAEELGEDLILSQYTIIALGLCVAIEILFDSMRGVITGHHRWDVHNILYAVAAFLGLILMGGVLVSGGNILHVAIAYLVSVISVEFLRLYLGLKIAPYIKRDPRLFSKSEAKELVTFGLKSLLIGFPYAAVVQIVNLTTVNFLGPAALAIYARQFALIRHLSILIHKFTMILAPTASSLQSLNNKQELVDFYLSTIRFNFAMAVPAIAVFVAYGDIVVGLWMGEEYQAWLLMALLASGHLLSHGQDACLRIMQGLNMHGRLSIYIALSLFLTLGATYFVLSFYEWTLLSSATMLIVPITISFGIVSPLYSCLKNGVGIGTYLLGVILTPAFLNLPFVAGLMASRILFQNDYIIEAGLTFIASGILELIIYYRYLLPQSFKAKLMDKLRKHS